VETYELPEGVQVSLLGLLNPGMKVPYIHDPFGLSDGYFKTCLGFIKQTVEQNLLICGRVFG